MDTKAALARIAELEAALGRERGEREAAEAARDAAETREREAR